CRKHTLGPSPDHSTISLASVRQGCTSLRFQLAVRLNGLRQSSVSLVTRVSSEPGARTK
ncbi:2358_t:CDS:1, partial [Acaulospora morrowiae]